ncbi:hypothetical protein V1498_19810 [Peribacillus sp. SCS-26]|uniref:hypothetical protein n=1 Tax=Paraperibacillus marinus TaxID=3115295 RepID=UPI003905767A
MFWPFIIIITLFLIVQFLRPAPARTHELYETDPDRIVETERAKTNTPFNG